MVGMRNRVMSAAVVSAVLVAAGGCRKAATLDVVPVSLRVMSTDIADGQTIPKQFTCDGGSVSPELWWDKVPPDARSFAVIVRDPDAPGGTFVHWVIYDLPPEVLGVKQGIAAKAELPDGSMQGVNSGKGIGYYGPCPPAGKAHRYVFSVYAVDEMLSVPPGADEEQVMKAMRGHVLAEGKLTARYGRG